MMTTSFFEVQVPNQKQDGKGGEGGGIQITNAEFINAIFRGVPENAFPAVCRKLADPSHGGWTALRANESTDHLTSECNNYLNCSSFYNGADGRFSAAKKNFAACHFLMLDDLGTKVAMDRLDGFELSWLIETSAGNYQGGIIFAEPVTDGDEAIRLLDSIITANLCDKGATGPLTRWVRLPVAINGKPEHLSEEGTPFQCRLVEWRPERRYTPEQVIELLQLELPPAGRPKKDRTNNQKRKLSGETLQRDVDDILIPRAEENPVIGALKARSLYKTPLGSGKHDITCPWVNEHTGAIDNGSAYFEPDETYPRGGFCCQHSHRDKYRIGALLEFLSINSNVAKNKPIIRVVEGELNRIVDSAEQELAVRGHHYQSGGLIVSISTDPTTGDPSIVPLSSHSLLRDLSTAITWERYTKTDGWFTCDPPERYVRTLDNSQTYRYLPPLKGLVRQPYFRESDGTLIMEAGYDPKSQRFAVFDPKQFEIPNPTLEEARKALAVLEDLLTEFHFVSPADKSAALSAIFTAVFRSSIPHAPAFHVKAPVFGSGKTYLCELIGSFAGPAPNFKVSYPTTEEEATKVILSLLLISPAVIEFDDMSSDWIPHGVIKRMLTAEFITDRILGVSKTATVSTRALLLGSGNNVAPIGDLLRRVLTIHLDARSMTPATLTYNKQPVEEVRRNRGKYVSAVLTIVLAWKVANSPKTNLTSIVTYGGAWSEYCRHPLVWLGHIDPATSLFEQINHDPEAELLRTLMSEWRLAFGSSATTVRNALDHITSNTALYDAICNFDVKISHGVIDPTSFGRLLSKHANRVVDGLEFRKAQADGRLAWKVVGDSSPTPPSPPSPPCSVALGERLWDLADDMTPE